MKTVYEYMNEVKPLRKSSKLAPFKNEILELRENGYTINQVRNWLTLNNVEISYSGLQAFLSPKNKKPDIEKKQTSITREIENSQVKTELIGINDEPESINQSSNDPAELRKILQNPPNLDEMARNYKKLKKENKT